MAVLHFNCITKWLVEPNPIEQKMDSLNIESSFSKTRDEHVQTNGNETMIDNHTKYLGMTGGFTSLSCLVVLRVLPDRI